MTKLKTHMEYSDSFRRFYNYDDITMEDLAQTLNKIANLKKEGWNIDISSNREEAPEKITVTFSLRNRQTNNIWAKIILVFKQES